MPEADADFPQDWCGDFDDATNGELLPQSEHFYALSLHEVTES